MWKKNETCLNKETHEKTTELLLLILNELHKSSSKDVIRKIIIRCVNTISKSRLFNANMIESAIKQLGHFLSDKNESIGQKLFIINVYLENLDAFGKTSLLVFRIILYMILI